MTCLGLTTESIPPAQISTLARALLRPLIFLRLKPSFKTLRLLVSKFLGFIRTAGEELQNTCCSFSVFFWTNVSLKIESIFGFKDSK